MAGVWAAWWTMAAVWCGVVVSRTTPGQDMGPGLGVTGLGLLALAIGLLLTCGYLLGRYRRWLYAWVLSGYVTVLLIALYVLAWLMVPPPAVGDNDTSAGAGVVFLGVPTFVIVGFLVNVGVVAGLIAGRLARGRTVSHAQ